MNRRESTPTNSSLCRCRSGQQKIFTPPSPGAVKRAFSSVAAIDDALGRAYVADEEGKLFAFDLRNLPKPIWNVSLIGGDQNLVEQGQPSAPVVSPNGAVVCVTWAPRNLNVSDPASNFTGSISCVNTTSATTVLYYSSNYTALGQAAAVLEVTPSISRNSTRVYVGSRRGILAFDLENATIPSEPLYISNSSLITHAIGTPLLLWEDYGVGYAISEACHLFAFSLANGSLVRRSATQLPSLP